MVEFLPIVMFKQRSDDNQLIEGGGSNTAPKWYLEEEELRSRSDLLASGLLDGLFTARKNPSLPYLFEVHLDSDDTSKTKRSAVAGMLEVARKNESPNIIGVRGNDSLIVQARDESAVHSMVNSVRDTERNIAGISCVRKISTFRPEVDLENAEGSYKVKLVDYQSDDINIEYQEAFEQSLAAEFIQFFRCEYADDLIIYDITASREQVQAVLDGIMGETIFSIKPMPRYEMVLDGLAVPYDLPDVKLPDESGEYPSLGILDSGIEPIEHLSPWLMEDRWSNYPSNEIDASHGTFVAGIAQYGDEFEWADWVGGMPARLFDAAVFPDQKVIDVVKESEIISNIREALSYAHDRAMVWNLSISGVGPIKPNEFSDFAIALDALQDKYGILICKTAGNSFAFLKNFDKWPLSKGADSVRALTVGSAAHEAGQYDRAAVGEASPFSCKGPGPEFIIKPEVSHYGGNAGVNEETGELCATNVHSFGTDGGVSETAGTSFSAPRVSALAANLDFALVDSDPLLVKTLIMHSASFADGKLIPADERVKELGFGIPSTLAQILSDNPYESTLVLRGTLAKGEKINIMDFPMPPSLVRDGVYTGQIIVTLAYNPILDATQGGEYCQSDIKVMFGSFEEKVLRDTTKPTYLNEIGRTDTLNLLLDNPYSRKRLKEADGDFALMERMLVEFAGKYAPVKKYAVDLADLKNSYKPKVGEDRLWYLQLEPLFRYNAEQKALRADEMLEQEFCVIVTVRDPQREAPVYNEVRQLLNANNFVHNPVRVRNQVRAHIGS